MIGNIFSDSGAMPEKWRHLAAMTSAAFFWALLEHLGGIVPCEYSPFQTVWPRYLFHLLFMLVVFAPKHGSRVLRTSRIGMQIARSLMMVGMPTSFIMGVVLLPLKTDWLFFWSCVVILFLLSGTLLGERIVPSLWFAGVSAWLGLLAIHGGGLPPLDWRYLAPLGMGLCFVTVCHHDTPNVKARVGCQSCFTPHSGLS